MSVAKLPRLFRDRIDLVFERCCGKKSKKGADFVGTVKVFWTSLNNSLSLVDLSSIWAVAASNGQQGQQEEGGLDSKNFVDFFSGIARLKYPSVTASDSCEMLLEDVGAESDLPDGLNSPLYSPLFDRAIDRNAIHELLKIDTALKNAYTTFAGDKVVNVDGGLAWEEVRRLTLGLEIEAFLTFAEAYEICPRMVPTERCTDIARIVLEQYPLSTSDTAIGLSAAALLYPQFELLVCLIAIEAHEVKISPKGRPASSGSNISFARKTVGHETIVAKIICEFFKEIKIGTPELFTGTIRRRKQSNAKGVRISEPDSTHDSDEEDYVDTAVSSSVCLDQYTSSLKHSRQAMLFRMQKLFATVEGILLADTANGRGPSPALLGFLANNRNEDALFNSKLRFASKPVVISDAIPLPTAHCPQAVEQLLQSALAHHNLGSFQETLLFLDAARTQYIEIKSNDSGKQGSIELPFELEMYIILSRGNLFRSCGEDEQAMICYMDGWSLSKEQEMNDWDIIFLNSIGVLAYYSIRYDISLLCFDRVVRFREQAYGSDSADTATALNNEGCSLFCMHERSEARLRFEKCWLVGSRVLGHRAPRAILMWRNLEKARRSSVATENKALRDEMKERVGMRPDSEKLLIGGVFSIKAVAPPVKAKKGKKKKAAAKKKK